MWCSFHFYCIYFCLYESNNNDWMLERKENDAIVNTQQFLLSNALSKLDEDNQEERMSILQCLTQPINRTDIIYVTLHP